MLSQKPHFIICITVSRSLAKTTVFGPVAAGIIKAHEQAMVAGIIINKGFTSAANAMLASTGNNILALAVLELNSVNINTNAITATKIMKKG